MKTFLFLLVSLFALASVDGGIIGEDQPLRIVDGKAVDLSPAIKAYKATLNKGVYHKSKEPQYEAIDKAWAQQREKYVVFGSVAEVRDEGAVIRGGNRTVLLRNYPRSIEKGKSVECFAVPVGDKDGMKVFDYGKVAGLRRQ